MGTDITWWVLYNVFLVIALTVDIRAFKHSTKSPSFKQAAIASSIWIGLAVCFNVLLFFTSGSTKALEFSAGYVVELSLSVDNLFVFLILFKHFRLPTKQQHYILMCGVIGALIMRLFFITVGIIFVEQFRWLFYIFGLFLIYTGVHLLTRNHDQMSNPSDMWLVKLVKKFIPVTDEMHDTLFVRKAGVLTATPLFIALIAIEATDLVFAADSIPAIFGITLDPFIVYTSNAFAILGLRSLYFVLERFMQLFSHLHYGISAVLVFIGIKMLCVNFFHIPTHISLLVIVSLIGASVFYSRKKR